MTTKYKCPLESHGNGSALCIFHDKTFAQNYTAEYMKKFYNYVSEQNPQPVVSSIKLDNKLVSPDSNTPTYCIGFHFFDEVQLQELLFSGTVHFSQSSFYHMVKFHKSTFRKAANFSDADFHSDADFSYCKFVDKANFSCAQFSNTAEFRRATFENEAYFNGRPKEKHLTFGGYTNFFAAVFKAKVNFSGAQFKDWQNTNASFTHIDFQKEAIFDSSAYDTSIFPSPPPKEKYNDLVLRKDAPIKFDDAIFRERVRFIGETSTPLQLGLVSLKGVELTNAIFHNVRWIEKGLLWRRNAIVDEIRLSEKKSPNGRGKLGKQNYEEVSGVYNQLRKNYEAVLSFHHASDFYIGEMETTRRRLWHTDNLREKFKSIVYGMYKCLNLYGESTFVPLLLWSPLIITIFAILRIYFGHCGPYNEDWSWTKCLANEFADSLAAYFQLPRENDDENLVIVERIISAPILAIAIKSFALTKRFETAIR
jgi:uncharacterized protein YjbI with pentapeptide repeats